MKFAGLLNFVTICAFSGLSSAKHQGNISVLGTWKFSKVEGYRLGNGVFINSSIEVDNRAHCSYVCKKTCNCSRAEYADSTKLCSTIMLNENLEEQWQSAPGVTTLILPRSGDCDCMMQWTGWSGCNTTCGCNGTETRSQVIASPKFGDGNECSPPQTQEQECSRPTVCNCPLTTEIYPFDQNLGGPYRQLIQFGSSQCPLMGETFASEGDQVDISCLYSDPPLQAAFGITFEYAAAVYTDPSMTLKCTSEGWYSNEHPEYGLLQSHNCS